jgi:arylsulfate sulfotransferase
MHGTLRLWMALALFIGSLGCEPTGTGTIPADIAPTDAAVETAEDAPSPPADVAADVAPTTPVFEDLTVLDSDLIQLVAWIDITTDLPTRISVDLEDLSTGLTTSVPYADTLAKTHAPVVMGLHAESSYRLHVTATSDAGLSVLETVDHATGSLPLFLSDIEAEVAAPEKMQPGYTLLSIDRIGVGEAMVIVDDAGRVVFYHSFAGGFVVPFQGGVFLQTGAGLMSSLFLSNLLGRISPELKASEYGSPLFHHLPGVTPEGTFLALGLEARSIDGYPEGDETVAYDVAGDLVLELTPEGELLRAFSLLDVLDPFRLGGSFHSPFWDMAFPDRPGGTKDWSHSNSVASDPDDGDLVVSVSSQNWVVKLDRSTGAVLWRLGPEGDFQLASGGRWSNFVHAAQPSSGGRLLLYDNEPADPPYDSRAVEYSLDTTTWMATQTWEYQVDPPVQSLRLGEAHRLENGNVLICDASITVGDDPHDPNAQVWSRIVEVTGPAPSEEVFRLTLRLPTDGPGGYRILTTRRIPDLYGGDPAR